MISKLENKKHYIESHFLHFEWSNFHIHFYVHFCFFFPLFFFFISSSYIFFIASITRCRKRMRISCLIVLDVDNVKERKKKSKLLKCTTEMHAQQQLQKQNRTSMQFVKHERTVYILYIWSAQCTELSANIPARLLYLTSRDRCTNRAELTSSDS